MSTVRKSLSHSSSDSSFSTGLNKSLASIALNNNNNIGGSSVIINNNNDDENSSNSILSSSNNNNCVDGSSSSPDQQQQQQQQQLQPVSNSNSQPLTLLQAVISGDVRKVRKMVVKGVSANEANERDPQGRTPLSIACSNGMVLTVEFLSFIPEIDPNKPDNEGNTPLLLAAQAGHVDCVRILLKEFRNVKLDHQNRKGYTALIQAAINGRTDCAKILMEAGANPFFADKVRKKNALQWAEFCGRAPCAVVIKEMSGRFPALVRHLVQAGQSVLSRHRSIWGSDGEIDRIAEREQMAAKSQGGGNERRGTISRLLQRSAKWIRSFSKRRKPSYKSLGALVSVGLAISGPAVTKQILDKSQLADEDVMKGPHLLLKSTKSAHLRSSTKGSKTPQSPPWRIPEVQIIAPSDEFCGRYSMAPHITGSSTVTASNNNGNNVTTTPHQQSPAIITSSSPTGGGTNMVPTQQQSDVVTVNDCVISSKDGSNKNSTVMANEAWGQHASAPTSPVLSSRSAERAHRRRFAQRAAATTSRQHVYQQHANGPTAFTFAYHDTIAAAEHFNAIAAVEQRLMLASSGDTNNDNTSGGGCSGDDDLDETLVLSGGQHHHGVLTSSLGDSSSIEEEDEMAAFDQQTGSNTTSSSNSGNIILSYDTTTTTTKKPY